ncbi:MAG: glycosyltransferase family 2 protein [Treponema sp.]|jgi:glycosyltransferase involved in cell wall biosynthesis|nr:glycosyltransferase family 2 protein [Treponema sp.]
MSYGFLIPVYNHGRTAVSVVERLSGYGLPVILVDDGSDGETKTCLAGIAAAFPQAVLVNRAKNGGKGAAVSSGIDKAHELGLSHVLQIDADGQHDAGRAAFFLEQSAVHPEAAVCGAPVFDDSVPESRKNGRKVSNAWARIVSLSSDITDVLCGFRVYPVEAVWRLIHRYHFDRRMGFDIEILIRLYWERIPLIFHPVSVVYPEGGVSHFHLVKDNIRISLVWTKLFMGMIIRLPLLVSRRFRQGSGAGKR